jgi:hypothetical protein
VVYFSEIDKIEADLPMTPKSSIMAALATWSSSSPIQLSESNKVTIIYKDGRVKKLSPRIFRNAFEEAFAYLRKAGKIHITIEGVPA